MLWLSGVARGRRLCPFSIVVRLGDGMRKSFSDVGLPKDHIVHTLSYHEPTHTLFAHTGPIDSDWRATNLWFRCAADAEYQPIIDFSEAVSIHSFVVDQARPSLYFITYSWHQLDGGELAGDWEGLYRFDLGEHRCDRLLQKGALPPLSAYERIWLCELHSLSASGQKLFCKVGMETPLLENGGRRADYWVAELDLGSMCMDGVTKLEALWA